MPDRQLVTPEELVDILNRQLARYPECESVTVSYTPLKFRDVDEGECNWDTDGIVLRGPLGAPEACGGAAVAAIREIAARYNLR